MAIDDDRLLPALRDWDNLYRKNEADYRNVISRANLSGSTFDIIYILLVDGEGLSQKEICDKMLSGKQTINSGIARLEEKGYIRSENGGARRGKIYFTDSGREVAERLVKPIVQAELKALSKMPRGDVNQFVSLYRTLCDNLSEELGKIDYGEER
ncbi:MAG: MarR family winged helix-turn-helix transcriptional regulator [Coriobacteriales bacterium]|jgi:DNA-binding MarR family transcriptional regulator